MCTAHVMLTPDEMNWNAGPPTLPRGVEVTVIEGVRTATGQHLTALEADVDASGGFRHQWPSAASTSSVSTPPVDFGCKNATWLPRMPARGCSSISRRPAERTDSSACAMSSVA